MKKLATSEILEGLNTQTPDKLVNAKIDQAKQRVKDQPKSSASWGGLGMVLLAHDFFPEAAECFGYASELDPAEPGWPYYESIAVQDLDVARSVERLEFAVQRFGPSTLSPQLRLAEVYIQQERFDDARRILDQVLGHFPRDPHANLLQAQLCLLNNKPAESLDHLRTAGLASSPTRQMALLAAEANRRQGKFDAAETWSQRAQQLPDVKKYSDELMAQMQKLRVGLTYRLQRADALFVQNRVDESIQSLRGLIADYPDSEWAHVLLARGLIRNRKLTEAEEILRQVLALNPNSFQAHFRMGVLHQVKRDFVGAAKWFTKTIELRPDAAVAHNNLGQCMLALNDRAGAEKSFRRAVEAQPNYVDGHLRLIEFYARAGDLHAATASLNAAQEIAPTNRRVQTAAVLLERERSRRAQLINP